jgi:hypothetical protein
VKADKNLDQARTVEITLDNHLFQTVQTEETLHQGQFSHFPQEWKFSGRIETRSYLLFIEL